MKDIPMLNKLCTRFFEDPASRELLSYQHPVLLPRDILSPHLHAL